MNTGKNRFRLLVLVPHRDARLPLRAWSASLFAAGMPGAWSFPWVTPLARLKRPLSSGELKRLARDLRLHINNGGGTLTTGFPALCAFPVNSGGGEISIFGPSLSIELPDNFFESSAEAIKSRISPLMAGAALVHGPLPDELPAPPQISFRAAALANMSCRFLPADHGGYFFEWKIGPLHWLPRKD